MIPKPNRLSGAVHTADHDSWDERVDWRDEFDGTL